MTKIILADQWIDVLGVKHVGGDVVEVDSDLARRLIYNGQARLDQSNEEVQTTAEPKSNRRAKKASEK